MEEENDDDAWKRLRGFLCCMRRDRFVPFDGIKDQPALTPLTQMPVVRRVSSEDALSDHGHQRNVPMNSVNYTTSHTRLPQQRRTCSPTFIFDPAGSFYYRWTCVVSIAFLYNLWVIIYRFSFDEITKDSVLMWFCFDYAADVVYFLDILMHLRTGYLEDGVLQTSPVKLHSHYLNTSHFYLDCLSLLPLDFLYLSLGFKSIVRGFRLVKVYRFWCFIDKTERHTNYPNLFRLTILLHYVLLLFHWNACLIFTMRNHLSFSVVMEGKNRSFHVTVWNNGSDQFYNYLLSYYMSCRTLTLIATLPPPVEPDKFGLCFVISEAVMGLLLFATVLGHIASIVSNVSAARKEFQAQLDRIKTYMNLRSVPVQLQIKVIRWFDYLWAAKKSSSEAQVLDGLPDKLKAEIAIHVHLDTLKRVEIFQNTEPGFLCDLVLRLRPMVFSPGDYICRKGEVGKEMYIVNRGKLQVLADDNRSILATLKAGSYFGEISILNMGTEGNRRTASVASVGYSDLFCLSKRDIWEVLQDYPAARMRLESIANKRLVLKKADENERKARLAKEKLLASQCFTMDAHRPNSELGYREWQRVNGTHRGSVPSAKDFRGQDGKLVIPTILNSQNSPKNAPTIFVPSPVLLQQERVPQHGLKLDKTGNSIDAVSKTRYASFAAAGIYGQDSKISENDFEKFERRRAASHNLTSISAKSTKNSEEESSI